MKVIFLDIDGVLNSHRSCMAFSGFPFPAENEVEGMWDKFDDVAIGLLKSVVNKSGAKVVLSSTWRLKATDDWLKLLGDRLGVEIIGVTPSFKSGVRGEEIQDWLDDNYPSVTHYCIVDDDADMLDSQKPKFVRTNHNDGLGYHNYLQMLAILDAEQ